MPVWGGFERPVTHGSTRIWTSTLLHTSGNRDSGASKVTLVWRLSRRRSSCDEKLLDLCSDLWMSCCLGLRRANALCPRWRGDLVFVKQRGACDTTYNFSVKISNGIVTHPILVKFRGLVTASGAVRASVTVQDKYASGSGGLSGSSGRGT
jgi:hypothetical protein